MGRGTVYGVDKDAIIMGWGGVRYAVQMWYRMGEGCGMEWGM